VCQKENESERVCVRARVNVCAYMISLQCMHVQRVKAKSAQVHHACEWVCGGGLVGACAYIYIYSIANG